MNKGICNSCGKLKDIVAKTLCERCYARQWYEKNPEKVASYSKKNYQKHKKDRRLYRRERIEELRIYAKQCYQKNKEREKERHKRRYQEHKNEILQKNKKYRNTPRGKLIMSKINARWRAYGFFILQDKFLPKHIKEEYHHCDNIFVYSLPEAIHSKTPGRPLTTHRKVTNNWLKNNYFFDFSAFLDKLDVEAKL